MKANVYLTHMARDYYDMNSVYKEVRLRQQISPNILIECLISQFFDASAMPARTCIGVAALPLGASVEIECMAEIPDSSSES